MSPAIASFSRLTASRSVAFHLSRGSALVRMPYVLRGIHFQRWCAVSGLLATFPVLIHYNSIYRTLNSVTRVGTRLKPPVVGGS